VFIRTLRTAVEADAQLQQPGNGAAPVASHAATGGLPSSVAAFDALVATELKALEGAAAAVGGAVAAATSSLAKAFREERSVVAAVAACKPPPAAALAKLMGPTGTALAEGTAAPHGRLVSLTAPQFVLARRASAPTTSTTSRRWRRRVRRSPGRLSRRGRARRPPARGRTRRGPLQSSGQTRC